MTGTGLDAVVSAVSTPAVGPHAPRERLRLQLLTAWSTGKGAAQVGDIAGDQPGVVVDLQQDRT